jgi:hypothetical protein
MGVWVYGCMGVSGYGCMGVWVYGCMVCMGVVYWIAEHELALAAIGVQWYEYSGMSTVV